MLSTLTVTGQINIITYGLTLEGKELNSTFNHIG